MTFSDVGHEKSTLFHLSCHNVTRWVSLQPQFLIENDKWANWWELRLLRPGRRPSGFLSIFVSRTHIFKFLLRLCLHPPDVVHVQLHPLVNPTEELAMEVGEDPLLLLEGAVGVEELGLEINPL